MAGFLKECRLAWEEDLHGELVGQQEKAAAPGSGPDGCELILLFPNLLSGTLARQSLLQPALLARFQIVGVTLHFLNDVFGLNLAFESTKGVLERLALLQSNFCHAHHPQTSPDRTPSSLPLCAAFGRIDC